jgi:hypothetical protein
MKREKEKRSKIAGGDLVVGSLGPVTGTSIIRSRGGSEPRRDSHSHLAFKSLKCDTFQWLYHPICNYITDQYIYHIQLSFLLKILNKIVIYVDML